jgi:phosphoribosyl 1,2-cyclic phosphate phosphodiesterase
VLRITLLGTGTSHGIPVVGCDCRVCRSPDERNRRTRASAFIQTGAASLLIDTATEFRLQAVKAGIRRIDAILLTHAHADHIHGLDDLRPLTRQHSIPIYGNPSSLNELAQRFNYIFRETQAGGGKPHISLHEVGSSAFDAAGVRVQPVPLRHGALDILGWRVGGFAYLTDVSEIPDSSRGLFEDLDLLVIGALRRRPHPTHFTVAQALDEIRRIRPKRAYLTHICHDLEHAELESELPPGVSVAQDGLELMVGE